MTDQADTSSSMVGEICDTREPREGCIPIGHVHERVDDAATLPLGEEAASEEGTSTNATLEVAALGTWRGQKARTSS